jgi:2-methylcitrate dehydratase PrpD
MADSIARQFARWAAGLKYEELPPAVVDKVKSLILLHLVSAVLGAQMPRAREMLRLIKAEEGKPDGATILWDGSKATRIGSTFANAELIHVAGLYDSFRMITHPGVSLIPAALVNAELGKKSLKDMITALAAGYELVCRLADDFVPSTAARGYRPAPIYHTIGAAVVAGKLMDMDEDRLVTTIAIAANCASGLFEAGRSGSGEQIVHDPNAARQGVFAALIAREGHIKGSEQVIEGPAGFYNAYTGSNTGKLTYAFTGPLQVDLASITQGLGFHYKLLTIMCRMYKAPGYNQPVINLMGELRSQHKINPNDIDQIEVTMNWLETLYPSPEFPREPNNPPRVGGTHYYAAHAAVNGGFPQVGGRTYGPTGHDLEKDEKVLAFMMNHVKVIGVKNRPMFSPAITVKVKNGVIYSGEYPYERMVWSFDQLVERLQDLGPRFPLGKGGFDALVETTRWAERLTSVDRLFELTKPK